MIAAGGYPGPVIRSSRRRRSSVAAVLALTAAVALTACGAGQSANTTVVYSPTNGAIGTLGPITMSNIVVVSDAAGAEVYGSLADTGGQPDALTGVSVSGADPVTLDGGTIEVPGSGAVLLGPSGSRVLVHNLTVPVGNLVAVTLQFRDAGHITLTTLVSSAENLRAGA